MLGNENTDEKRKGSHLVPYHFKPGNSGRPKGARNKLGEAFIEALHEDFQSHGIAAIVEVREKKPDQYLKVIAGLLPKELHLNMGDETELTDDELIQRIRSLSEAIAPLLVGGTGEPAQATDGETIEGEFTRVH